MSDADPLRDSPATGRRSGRDAAAWRATLALSVVGVGWLMAAEQRAYSAPRAAHVQRSDPKRGKPKPPPPPVVEIAPALAPSRADGASAARPIVRPPVRILPMGGADDGGAAPAVASDGWRRLGGAQRSRVSASGAAQTAANFRDRAILTSLCSLAPPRR